MKLNRMSWNENTGTPTKPPATWRERLLTAALLCSFYLAWSGFKPSMALIQGGLATWTHHSAGFSIDYPPYWFLYSSGAEGRKAYHFERVFMYQRRIARIGSSVSVQRRPSESPSVEEAYSWATSLNVPFIDLLDESIMDSRRILNGSPAFVQEVRKPDRLVILAIVLGKENEYLLTLNTAIPLRKAAVLKQILESFEVLDGY